MKIVSIIIAISLLTVSITPAQQEPISPEQRQMIVQQAKEDAFKDANVPLHVVGGCCLSFLSFAAYTMLTFELNIFGSRPTYGEIAGEVCMSGSFGSMLAIIPSIAAKASPPANRLLGKSSAYVRIYTQTYKAQIVEKRMTGTFIGSAVGVGAMLIFLYVARVDD